jgi:hypothetical protein
MIRRTDRARMRVIDTRAVRERELRRTMVSSDETLGQAEQTIEVDNNIPPELASRAVCAAPRCVRSEDSDFLFLK